MRKSFVNLPKYCTSVMSSCDVIMKSQRCTSGRKSRPVSANKVPENVQFAEVKVKQSGRDLNSMEGATDRLKGELYETYQ